VIVVLEVAAVDCPEGGQAAGCRSRNDLGAANPEEETISGPSRLTAVIDVCREAPNSATVYTDFTLEYPGYASRRDRDEEGRSRSPIRSDPGTLITGIGPVIHDGKMTKHGASSAPSGMQSVGNLGITLADESPAGEKVALDGDDMEIDLGYIWRA
jgi:hypothetical protein